MDGRLCSRKTFHSFWTRISVFVCRGGLRFVVARYRCRRTCFVRRPKFLAWSMAARRYHRDCSCCHLCRHGALAEVHLAPIKQSVSRAKGRAGGRARLGDMRTNTIGFSNLQSPSPIPLAAHRVDAAAKLQPPASNPQSLAPDLQPPLHVAGF